MQLANIIGIVALDLDPLERHEPFHLLSGNSPVFLGIMAPLLQVTPLSLLCLGLLGIQSHLLLDLLQLEFVLIQKAFNLVDLFFGFFDLFRCSPNRRFNLLLNFRFHLKELIAILNKLCLLFVMTDQYLVLLFIEGLVCRSALLIRGECRL